MGEPVVHVVRLAPHTTLLQHLGWQLGIQQLLMHPSIPAALGTVSTSSGQPPAQVRLGSCWDVLQLSLPNCSSCLGFGDG